MALQEGVPPHGSDPAGEDGRLKELRDILLREDEQYLTDTVRMVLAEATARRVQDSRDEMAEALAPVLGQAIRRQIEEAQDDIVDALYPIIGRTIQRAVSDAMRALARRVDAGLRSTFSFRRLHLRLRARLKGIPESELLLRESLPFRVQQVFLIHRASGLLLAHLSEDPGSASDSDIIGSMLTAIRDFAHDSFGAEREGELDQVQYGDVAILLEPGPWAYLAVVIEGVEPEGFRHEMREALSAVHRSYGTALEEYDGDASRLAGVEKLLVPLLAPPPGQPGPKAAPGRPWLAVGLTGAVVLLCLTLACLGAWRLTWGRPTPTATPTWTWTAVATVAWTSSPTPTWTSTTSPSPTPTASPLPSETATPTHTPSPTPTQTPTPLPSPTSPPFIGVMIGTVWLRTEPRPGSPVLATTAEQGRPVEILAIYATWYQIRFPPGDPAGTSGWVPARWVGLVAAPPLTIITPGP